MSETPVPTVALVDYGAGNLVSIEQALVHVGARVRIAERGSEVDGADALVVPGVGASGSGFTVTGVADPGNKVSEADETNNQLVQTVVILP